LHIVDFRLQIVEVTDMRQQATAHKRHGFTAARCLLPVAP
jgi:hypothetical protein